MDKAAVVGQICERKKQTMSEESVWLRSREMEREETGLASDTCIEPDAETMRPMKTLVMAAKGGKRMKKKILFFVHRVKGERRKMMIKGIKGIIISDRYRKAEDMCTCSY